MPRPLSVLEQALRAGTTEHYEDPLLYDHEYKRRRVDIDHYLEVITHELARRGPARRNGRVGEVLELGCGTGRLLLPLVRAGHEVTGVDASRAMLSRLEERAERLPVVARPRVHSVEGDFRSLRLRRRFRVVVCPFNAMMHLYTRQDCARFFATVRAHLAPGGLFAFDVLFPDLKWLSRDPRKQWGRTRFRHPRTGQETLYSHSVLYDAALQIAFMRILYEPTDGEGRTRVVHLTHRYFFPLELETLLEIHGFRIESMQGDFEGGPLEPGAESMVVRCRLARRR